jgi:hypothetical protein
MELSSPFSGSKSKIEIGRKQAGSRAQEALYPFETSGGFKTYAVLQIRGQYSSHKMLINRM